jgi:hypothetical protein
MQGMQPDRGGEHLIQEIGAAWRRHGPGSNQFHELMAEAIDRVDAGDLLYQTCASVGDDSERLADDMRRHVAEAPIMFPTPGAGPQCCQTAVFAVPVVGGAEEVIRLAGDAKAMDLLRRGLARHRVFPPGSQIAFLRAPMFADDLCAISPDALHALRQSLAVVAFEGEECVEDGTRWRDVAEDIGGMCLERPPGSESRNRGWTVGFLVGVRVTPVSDYDPPPPDEEDLQRILCVAFEGWQDEAQAVADAAGFGVLMSTPSHYDDAVCDGLGALVRVLLNLEYEARNHGNSLPEPWDEVHIYAWGGTLAVTARLDGNAYGPVGIPAAQVHQCMSRFTEDLENAGKERLVVHRADERPQDRRVLH